MSSDLKKMAVICPAVKDIAILICTINSRIENVVKKLIPQLDGCEVCVAHQITDGLIYADIANGENIKYSSMREAGLSQNRNLAMSMTSARIAIICDDDVVYLKGFSNWVKKTHAENYDADIITFAALNEKSEIISNASRRGDYWHDRKTILSVCSIMITFKIDRIRKAGILFDEEFGIGSTWGVGEEAIFLKDALDKRLKIWNSSRPIVIHEGISTGRDYDENLVKSRPAVFTRLFGPMGGLFSVLNFTIFHFPLYKNKFNPWRFFWLSLSGYLAYMKRRRTNEE